MYLRVHVSVYVYGNAMPNAVCKRGAREVEMRELKKRKNRGKIWAEGVGGEKNRGRFDRSMCEKNGVAHDEGLLLLLLLSVTIVWALRARGRWCAVGGSAVATGPGAPAPKCH